jgi:hypothetical protein
MLAAGNRKIGMGVNSAISEERSAIGVQRDLGSGPCVKGASATPRPVSGDEAQHIARSLPTLASRLLHASKGLHCLQLKRAGRYPLWRLTTSSCEHPQKAKAFEKQGAAGEGNWERAKCPVTTEGRNRVRP